MARPFLFLLTASLLVWGCVSRQKSDWQESPMYTNKPAQTQAMGRSGAIDVREAAALLSLKLEIKHVGGTFHLVDTYNDIAVSPGKNFATINGQVLDLPFAPFFKQGSLQIPRLLVYKLARSDVPVGAEFLPFDWYVQPNRSWQFIFSSAASVACFIATMRAICSLTAASVKA